MYIYWCVFICLCVYMGVCVCTVMDKNIGTPALLSGNVPFLPENCCNCCRHRVQQCQLALSVAF